MVKFLIIVTTIINLLYLDTLFGQVATPSLDLSTQEEMAAATGWRDSSTVAGSAGKDSRKEMYNTYESDATYSEYSYLVASHIIGTFYTEVFQTSIQKEITNEQEYRYNFQEIKTQSNFALRLTDFLSIGGSYYLSTIKESDETPISKTSSTDDQIGIGYGLSWRIGMGFVLGAGTENVTEESNSKVPNEWSNWKYGIAYTNGLTKDSTYRLEYSIYDSTESLKPSSEEDSLIKNYHHSSYMTRIAAEYLLTGIDLLLLYQSENRVDAIAQDQNLVVENQIYGFVYQPEGIYWGKPATLLIKVAYVQSKERYVFSDSSKNFDKTSPKYYRATIGINF
jgi:hypothetical protein